MGDILEYRPPRRRGEAVRRAVVSGHRVGAAYQTGPWTYAGDGIEYRLHQGHELRVVLRHLTTQEIAKIRRGRIDLALVVEPLVFSLLAWFEGVIPWSGAPFSWHSLPEAERVLLPSLAAGEQARLAVVLVEGTDGIVRAVRSLSLSAEFSLALRTAIGDQADRVFDQEEYQRQATGLWEHWRAGDLVHRASARWSSSRAGTWRP
jgi:hypothetical protein